LFEAPTIAGVAELIIKFRTLTQEQVGLIHRTGVMPVARDIPLPASFAQQRLWFLDQLEPNNKAFNIPAAYRLVGSVNVTALEQAINEVVRRHEVLRTTFTAVDGEPLQIIAPSLHVPLPVASLEMLPVAEREAEALRLAVENAYIPFDLSHGPLLRAQLLRLGVEDHILALTLHHIVTDGWSIGVFKQELAELYEAFSQGRESPLVELPVQYADFAVWQRKWLEDGALAEQLAYWRANLEGASDLSLHTDRPRPALISYEGARQRIKFPARLSSALNTLSRRAGVTLFMTLLAAFQVLLYRYTGQEDIVVGTPIANRDRSEIEGLIGFFVNTLVLRTDLSPAASGTLPFQDLLARVRETCLGAYANQHVPFEKLVEELHSERDLSRNPLFQVLFAVQNAPQAAMEMAGTTVTPVELPGGKVRFDLECHLWEEGEEIQGNLIYNTDLFDGATMIRMIAHYQTLLWNIAANPKQGIAEIPILLESEQQQIVVEWNATGCKYPGDACVHDIYAEQVEQTPERVAVQLGEKRLTYEELNQRANQLAHYLKKLGVGPEVIVGLCIERSLEMVVGLLGILKAGGAYLPLDPTNPPERLLFMLQDARAGVVVTQANLMHKLADCGAKLVCVDRDQEILSRQSAASLPNAASPDSLIYVMYTSGTTGRPKGVAVTHRGVVRLVKGSSYARFDGEVFLQLAPLSFDASTFEIWGALLNGAKLVLMQSEKPSLAELARALREGGVTTLWLTAGLFHVMVEERLEDLGHLHQLLAGGDVLPAPDVAKVVKELPTVRLINGYGPTENTTFSMTYDVFGRAPVPSVPIGRPIANTQAYILDRNMQPVPAGVAGELYLGGAGLARGYLNNPRLTAEKFVPNPYCRAGGARLYRTGDIACYLPDGNIEFLGRTDNQVKLRGFRIELGEIEAVLRMHPLVRDSVILAREDFPGEKRLVAYVVSRDGHQLTNNELRQYLGSKLPEYMLPSATVFLDELPLSFGGKVDRSALEKPGDGDRLAKEAIAVPRDQVERQLVRIWEDVLDVHPIGLKDNFFDLGGHSLLGIRLLARIEKELGKKLPVALLFQSPTVEQLAQAIRGNETLPDWSTIVPIQAGGSKRPFFCVHGFGGGVLGYSELARLLGPEQPFYGLQAIGLSGVEEPDTRIEDMASRYVQAIRSIQPAGPYCLGGYCYGGVVAFEIARQLLDQGELVALLAILEGYALQRVNTIQQLWRPRILARFMLNLPYWLRDLLHEPDGLQKLWSRYRRKPRGNLERREWDDNAERVITESFGDEPDVPESHRRVMAIHLQAIKAYNPQAHSGRVTLFRVRTLSLFRSYDPEMGWGKLATGGVEVKMIAGAHYNFLQQPNVGVLADKLRESLDQAQEHVSHR
jgi:amino acid adenylation domain-containing protein